MRPEREVKEKREETEAEGCCILDFVVFPVDVAVCKLWAHTHTLCQDQSTTSSSIIKMASLVYN